MNVERTLVLIKPDGVERGIAGQIITRFEQAGLKIVGLKLAMVDEDFAKKHYTDDIAKRRGEHVRKNMVDMLASGPIIAMVLEGIEAIALVRKMVGATEPKAAEPGTIRGDFAHVSYAYSDAHNIGVKNVVHASSSPEDAAGEISLWFAVADLHSYSSVHDKHILK
ncbi:MAG: nucleoside-diphosphate kinase [Patescibacteria group bacterium]